MVALTARARTLWEALAGASFASRPLVTVAPHSAICPPGWVGVIALEKDILITAPYEEIADKLRVLPDEWLTDLEVLARAVPGPALGPASLAYLDAKEFRPSRRTVDWASGSEVEALLASVSRADAEESGLADVTSPVCVIREAGWVVAASGYQTWPHDVAHLSVLTAPSWRGLGLARDVASAAVELALAEGLLPQWRARSGTSRRVAGSLGFREIGTQLGFLLE